MAGSGGFWGSSPGGSSSGSSSFWGGGSSSSSPSKGSGFWGGTAKTSTSKSGGGGVLGALGGAGHWVAAKAGLAAHDIKAIPGGTIDLVNKDVVQPWKDVVTTGHVKAKTNAGIDQSIASVSKSTADAINHPLRDPLQTLLTVLPAAHGLGSGVARAGAAADAARAGEGVGGTLKALATKPEMPQRLLKVGDAQIPLHASQNPAVRLAQALHDTVVQRALDKNPEGRIASYGTKRLGGSLQETTRYQTRMRAVPADLLDKAAKKLAPTGGKVPGTTALRLQRAEQAALELTSANTGPDEAAAYHAGQAAKGVSPELNSAVAKLYQKVADAGMLTRNEHGDVIVNEATHPRLASADVKLAKVQGRGDEILARYGLRSPEALQSRVDAPGKIRAGAEYVKPTPGRQGVESPTLKAAVAERDRLAALHEKALQQDERWHAQPPKDLRGPMTTEQAHARLAELDKQHQALVEKIVPEVSQYGGKLSQREQLRRNFENSRAGKGNRVGASRMPTVKSEEASLAADKLAQLAEKHAGTPWADNLQSLLNEREQLRGALNSRAEAPIFGGKAEPLPRVGAQPELPPLQSPYRNRIVQFGHALEVAQQKVDRLQKGAARRVEPTGIVGGDAAREGRGFLSYRTSEPRAPKTPVASAQSSVVGEARSPIITHSFTGTGIEHGMVPNDITGQAARHLRQILRYANTSEFRSAALKTGSDVRRTSRDVLVKVPGAEHGDLTPQIEEALGKTKLTTDDVEGITAALDAYRHELVPGLIDKFAADRATPIGMKAPEGHRWVDRNILGDLAKPRMVGERGYTARKADAVNSAVTAATVYFKIGHVGTRVLTNASTNILQGSGLEGAHAIAAVARDMLAGKKITDPHEIAHSYRMWHALTDEEQGRALAAAGQHGFQAMPHEGTSLASRVAGRGANWWAKHADAPFRFNSIAYEARKAGFDTPAKFRHMLNKLEDGGQGLNAAEAAKIDWVAKRANRAQIAYDRMSESERRFLARAIWFYPWVKGATMFAGHTVVEHPYKAAGLEAAGVHGRQQQEKQLGDVPSYEEGLFQLAGGPRPLVADFSTFSPFSTPADLMQIPRVGRAADLLNPVLGAGVQAATRENQFGQHSNQPLTDALSTLFSSTPEAQIVAAAVNRKKDQSKRMFHTTPMSAFERSLVGPGMPRRVNVSALASAAARERSGR